MSYREEYRPPPCQDCKGTGRAPEQWIYRTSLPWWCKRCGGLGVEEGGSMECRQKDSVKK